MPNLNINPEDVGCASCALRACRTRGYDRLAVCASLIRVGKKRNLPTLRDLLGIEVVEQM